MFTLAQDACVPERSRELDLKAFSEKQNGGAYGSGRSFFVCVYRIDR